MIREIAQKRPCTEKFLRWILPRGLLVILVLVICLVFIGMLPNVEAGTVEYKLVTGKNEQTRYILLINMDRRNIVVAEKMRDIIPADYEQMPIDQKLENKIREHYTDIQYKVILKLSKGNTIKSYVVPREVFNAAETNSLVKLQTEGIFSNRVREIVSDDDNMFAIDANNPPASDIRQFMHQ